MTHHLKNGLRGLLLIVAFCLTGSVYAQETTGNLVGTVKDASGGVVKGATVTITDSDKNVVVRTVTTNDDGGFSVPLLPVAF